jgi:uncharacterized protein
MRCTDSKQILIATIISEGILVGLGIVITLFMFDNFMSWNLTPTTALVGGAMSIPPLIVNFFLWSYSKTHTNSIFYRFSSEVIIPLCISMNLFTIFVVAVTSGICEEFFFRGVLNNLFTAYVPSSISCVVTSFIFAFVHFIGNLKRYAAMLPLYFLMGCYLWLIYQVSNSLGAVALTHGIYNFVVITMTKYAGAR